MILYMYIYISYIHSNGNNTQQTSNTTRHTPNKDSHQTTDNKQQPQQQQPGGHSNCMLSTLVGLLSLSWKSVTNMTCSKQDFVIYIYIYILRIGCGSTALDAHKFSQNGCGPVPRTKAQGAVGRGLGDLAPCAPGPGPGPICMRIAHMCIKGHP